MRDRQLGDKVGDIAFHGLLASVGVACLATVACLIVARHLLEPCVLGLSASFAALWIFCLLVPPLKQDR